MKEQTATLRYLHIAPRKVRLIANTLRGMPVQEAEAQLFLRPQRASEPLLKLLRSAIANAKTNQKMNPNTLFVSAIRVDQGPVLKRSLPRAQGRATPIHKIMSHVTITLAERGTHSERFTILPPVKKEKKPEKNKRSTPKAPHTEGSGNQKPKDSGFLKKMFQRKSV